MCNVDIFQNLVSRLSGAKRLFVCLFSSCVSLSEDEASFCWQLLTLSCQYDVAVA